MKLLPIALVALSSALLAHAAIPPLALKPISLDELHSPTVITNAGDGSGRLFICEQHGLIRIVKSGMLFPTPFLDLTAKIIPLAASYDERGLLGLAFHPDFTNNAAPGYHKFYVHYSAVSPTPSIPTDPVNRMNVIAEYQVSAGNPNIADPLSERILLTFDGPQSNHNGGQIDFGPTDHFLYIASGDGGSSDDNNYGHTGGDSTKPNGPTILGNAQDKTRLLGKILRIDPFGTNGLAGPGNPAGSYGIPATNPFVGAGGGVREEIYAFGLRNPFRFSFDVGSGGTNRLFCGDVGQNKVEEVDLIVAGGNYGWRILEGNIDHDPLAPSGGSTLIPPIAEYAHPGVIVGGPVLPQIGISVSGGYVYRGSAIPALQGVYIFGDYSSTGGAASGSPAGVLLGLEESSPLSGTFALSTLNVFGGNPLTKRIYTFGRDEAGELYVGTKTTTGPVQNDPGTGKPAGGIYKIVPLVVSTTTLQEPSKDTTIYSDDLSGSNAQGSLFSGRLSPNSPNGIAFRRAFIAFDVSSVPAGAIVQNAQLRLKLTRSSALSPGPTDSFLHRVTAEWFEGTSAGAGTAVPATANDATWDDRIFGVAPWANPGGDFAATTSAVATVNAPGVYTWNAPQMATDVQGWVTDPASNFGWILIGDEGQDGTAKMFASGEDFFAADRPKLVLDLLAPAPLTRRESWLQQYFPVGHFVDDFADLDGDSLTNQLEYAFAFSPLAANPPGAGFNAVAAPSGALVNFTMTFRRDPRATDLTYQLQTSPDLVTWTTVVSSAGGAVPSGPRFISETDVAGESPIKLVTGRETFSSAVTKRFARLRIIRQL